MSFLFIYFNFLLNSKGLIVALNKHVASDEQILAGAQITKWLTSLQHKQWSLALTQYHNKAHTIERYNSVYIDMVFWASPQISHQAVFGNLQFAKLRVRMNESWRK